jgi:hypothetical protein
MWNIDTELFCEHNILTRDCWPIKVMADHTFHLSEALVQLLLPCARLAKGKEGRIRSIVHTVPEDQVLSELANFGITKEMVPIVEGGSLRYSILYWIVHRQQMEAMLRQHT